MNASLLPEVEKVKIVLSVMFVFFVLGEGEWEGQVVFSELSYIYDVL